MRLKTKILTLGEPRRKWLLSRQPQIGRHFDRIFVLSFREHLPAGPSPKLWPLQERNLWSEAILNAEGRRREIHSPMPKRSMYCQYRRTTEGPYFESFLLPVHHDMRNLAICSFSYRFHNDELKLWSKINVSSLKVSLWERQSSTVLNKQGG